MSNTKILSPEIALSAISLIKRQERLWQKTLLACFSLLLFTAASAGISTKKQDSLKLIGTSFAHNGKFAWIELNGEDYGWTREGGNVGKYIIVMVEMGKVKLELFGRVVEFHSRSTER